MLKRMVEQLDHILYGEDHVTWDDHIPPRKLWEYLLEELRGRNEDAYKVLSYYVDTHQTTGTAESFAMRDLGVSILNRLRQSVLTGDAAKVMTYEEALGEEMPNDESQGADR